MTKVHDAYSEPAVIRTAAEAALTMLVRKYYALTDHNEVYWIATGLFLHNSLLSAYLQVVSTVLAMCPDKKLEWFKKNLDWHVEDQVEAHHVVCHHWEQTYAGETKLWVDNRHDNHQPKVRISVLSAHPKNLSEKTELLWHGHTAPVIGKFAQTWHGVAVWRGCDCSWYGVSWSHCTDHAVYMQLQPAVTSTLH